MHQEMNHSNLPQEEEDPHHSHSHNNQNDLPSIAQYSSVLHRTVSSSTTRSTNSNDDQNQSYYNNHNHQHKNNSHCDEISKPSMQFYHLEQTYTTLTTPTVYEQESNHSNLSNGKTFLNSDSNGNSNRIGQVSIELLQCLGLPLGNDPKSSVTGSSSATTSSSNPNYNNKQALPFALIVCGSYAFQTDGGITSSTATFQNSSNAGTPTGGSKHHSGSPMNPVWTSEMRRACTIPLDHAYARVYIGIFRQRRRQSRRSQPQQQQPAQVRRVRSNNSGSNGKNHNNSKTIPPEKSHKHRDIFIGRVVMDVARLRPHSYYDVTIPLRQSSQVYIRPNTTSNNSINTNNSSTKNMNETQLNHTSTGGCGAVRFRIHVQYDSERRALLSYLMRPIRQPSTPSNQKTNNNNVVTVHCCDVQSFQNVSRVVHGMDMPNHFSIRQLQATIREINLTRIHVLRYLRKQECDNLYHWRHPTISAIVFMAYMHSIYCGSLKYIPGHVLTYLLLHLYKNYADYGPMNSIRYNDFIPPTWEEMFMALLFRNGTIKNHIAPIEMEIKADNQDSTSSSTSDSLPQPPQHPTVTFDAVDMAMSQHTTTGTSSSASSVSTGKIPLKAIAQAFQDGVNTQSLRYHFRVYHNVFRGNDAVTFLVQNGHAFSREQAVTIGRRLSEQMRLFVHVTQEHRFEDKPLFYVYTHHDRYEYVVKTHQPLGKSLFRMLGFLPSSNISKTKAQLEMPYTDGTDHPRMKVKESLCLPFKSAKKALVDDIIENEQAAESDESDSMSEGFEHGMTSFLDQNSLMDETNEDEADNDTDSNSIQYLKKPPNQNMSIKNKNEKPIPAILNEARNKVHGVLLHLFDDRVYQLPKKVNATTKRKVSPSRRNLIHAIKSQRHLDSPHHRDDEDINKKEHAQQDEQCEAAVRNEYDKLLGVGKYSHPNVVIARLGLFVQPIIEIAIGWLSLFRALFNIFTWQDPILSFWISILGPIVIVILHVFPWRLVLGMVGVVVLGPHNWIRRILRERKYGPDLFDPDRIIHRKKSETVEDDPHRHVPLFSSYLADSGRVLHSEESEMELLSARTIRQVIVPYSPLMYSHRFYDWPPEREHTRVSTSCSTTANGFDGTTMAGSNRDVFNSNGPDDIMTQSENSQSRAYQPLDSPTSRKIEVRFEDDPQYDSDDAMIRTKSHHLIHRRRRRRRPFQKDGAVTDSHDEDTGTTPPSSSPRWKVPSSLQQFHEKLRHRHPKGTLHHTSSMED